MDYGYYLDLGFLVGARIVPLCGLPFFVPSRTGFSLRIVIFFCLTGYFTWLLAGQELPGNYFLGLVGEFFWGLVLFFITTIFFSIPAAMGSLAQVFSGGIKASTTEGRSSWEHLFYLFGVIVFFSINGHLYFLQALGLLFRSHPPGSAQISSEMIIGSVNKFIDITGFYFATSFLLSLPVIFTILVCNLGFGIVSRFFPSINAYFLSLSLKNLLVVIVIGLSIPSLVLIFKQLLGQIYVMILS
ncbi:MAG: flagellar biosynthetic protein FliR [Myxococcota bacterium]